MERITYRKTLDVHKNGIQFMLQGFETADKLSRVIEISLMASGDAIDFPLERMVAMMYVTTPSAEEPSINSCTIKDNKVVYEVLPIVEEGITTMQLKLMEVSPEGATSVLASPKFVVEVTKSNADDEGAEQTTTFTALEDAVARAKAVYDARFLRMELTNDCIFKAYYAGENEEHGAIYETDILKKLFYNGNVILSESYAHGGTGTRIGEDTDNSMYYSNVSKSEALNAKSIMEDSKEILEEVKLHGMYTAFSVDFETGTVEYVSPSFKFTINQETGELEAEGQTYTFDDEVGRVVTDWLATNGVKLEGLQDISTTHTEEILNLKERATNHTKDIDALAKRVTPIELGGTGATTKGDALENLGATRIKVGSYEGAGEWGSDNPNTLEFEFAPKFLKIMRLSAHSDAPNCNYLSSDTVFMYPCTVASTYYDWSPNSSGMGIDDAIAELVVEWGEKSVSWFANVVVEDKDMVENRVKDFQMNASGETYYYIALG